jgi:SRSO17 transposase
MTPDQLREIEQELHEYFEYCFGGLGRRERREALSNYLFGLLLDGERKSVSPIAARIVEEGSRAEAMRQRLQQALVVAKWDEGLVYRRIAERFEEQVEGIEAFVIDDTGFPKKGRHSVGVQRQYCGTLGRIDNCQVATSLHLASEQGGACIGMHLYMPKVWTEDEARCRKVGVPESLEFQKKSALVLELLDCALQWGLARHVVLADSGYGDGTGFRDALQERELEYVLGITPTLLVSPAEVEVSPPPGRKGRSGGSRTLWQFAEPPRSGIDHATQLPRSAYRKVTWRQGSKGPQSSRFAAVRVRTARGYNKGAAPSDEQWLLIEWPAHHKEPTQYWLSNLPPETSRKRLVYLAKLRWRVERDYQEMKGELGLDHFEGRTWRGFHHHCACVAAAHAFLALQRARHAPGRKKN